MVSLLNYCKNIKQKSRESSDLDRLPQWLQIVIEAYEKEKNRLEREILSAKVSKRDDDES